MLHVSPGFTLTNLLQLLTMPDCVGVGVAMPLAPTTAVGVGVAVTVPVTPMHAYVPACRLVQGIPPTPPFQRTKFSVEMGPL